ncbi:hypothetical protein Ancab_030356 [Ancistrocladus abbreviatus]
MNFTATAFSLLNILIASITVLSTAQTPVPEENGGCADKVVSFSPCLSYVSAPPNNSSSSPTSTCCRAYCSISDSSQASCLCYLLREPSMLSFPLDISRLLSLSSICQRKNRTNGSLDQICSGVRASPSPKLESDESPSSSSNESRSTPPSTSSHEIPTPPSTSSHEIPTPPPRSVEYNPAFSSAGKIRSSKCSHQIIHLHPELVPDEDTNDLAHSAIEQTVFLCPPSLSPFFIWSSHRKMALFRKSTTQLEVLVCTAP